MKKKKSNPYKEANEAFLAAKAREEGIVVLDKWEVYIPAKWGYGSMKMDDIPAHSTLIFELELVKIER